MRRWIIIAIIVVVLLGLLAFLSTQGYLEGTSWQSLTMIGAAIAAPFKYIYGKIQDLGENNRILDKHEEIRKDEKKHRETIDVEIKEKEQRIKHLDEEIQVMEAKVEIIEKKQQRVKQEVEEMTVDEKINEARNLWGS